MNMKKTIIGIFLLYSVGLLAQTSNENTNATNIPKVQTISGILQGTGDGTMEAFKGIPYAAPPIGALRWRPPQPVKAWRGIRDASKFCADCAQASWPRSKDKIRENTSEDCLFINLW